MNKEINEKNEENGRDIRIAIDVSPDKLEAYITITLLKDPPDFSVDEIKEAISDKGIKYGIKEDVLAGIREEKRYNEKILIAAGLSPTQGKASELKYFFDTGKTAKINKGDNICEIMPPVENTDGTDVYGEIIHLEDIPDVQIPELTNAEISPDNKNYIVSKINGYLSVDLNNISVVPFFELEKITDHYEAYVEVRKLINDGDFTGEDLKRFLNENEIVFGIKKDEIEAIFQQNKFNQRILIAQGEKVINGKNGEIKYYFDRKTEIETDEHGNVNYKELNLIKNVKKGQKLAESIPPTKGTEGCTIFGEKIAPKDGLPTVLPTGKNTCPDPDNPKFLLAEIDGHVKLKGKTIEVEPVFAVKGNVDFSTGNIDYIGSIIIDGDVQSGFKVKAKNDVQVNGFVEDAVIEAGRDVLIKTGFAGKGEGKIIANGTVMVNFCENENIICKGDISIGNYVMNSNIQTKGKLIVTEQKGLIVGGEIYAVKGIEANVIGNQYFQPTALFIGIDKDINNKIKEKVSLLSKNAENSLEIEKALNLFAKRKLIKKELPENKKTLLEKLIQAKEKLEKEEKKLLTEIEELQKKSEAFKNSVVKILEAVYPGTSITIHNKHTTVSETMKYIYYKYTDKEIVAVDLEDIE